MKIFMHVLELLFKNDVSFKIGDISLIKIVNSRRE